MKSWKSYALSALLIWTSGAYAQINVGSDGSDGAFEPVANVEVDLSLAGTGPGTGVYDATEWAVIFNYTSVTIPSGVTVTFKNHPSGAPVIWLVSGSVTIAGTVSLDGEGNTGTAARAPIPGPGGFRGGRAFLSLESEGAGGHGPGGGNYDPTSNHHGVGGSYGTLGGNVTVESTYGNEKIVPLIGGSGGSSGRSTAGRGAGAGGGAILIAANNTITLTGSIHADGGGTNTCCGGYFSGGGSGGGIRLIADLVTGGGSLLARGGTGIGAGGKGRIRVEANTNELTHAGDPTYTQDFPDVPPMIFPPAASPVITVTMLTVGVTDIPVPIDPSAKFEFPSQDVSLDAVNPVTVHLAATDVPLDWVVEVRAVAKSGSAVTAIADPLVGTVGSSTTTASITLPRGFTAIQARAAAPTP